MSASTPEKKPTPASSRHRSSADWLGLKTNDDLNYLEDDHKEVKSSAESPKPPSSPLLERKPDLTSVAKTAADAAAPTNNNNVTKQTKSDVSKSQRKNEEEEDDWLAGALSRKKALSGSNTEAVTSKQEDSSFLGEQVDLESSVRYRSQQ